MSSESHHQAAQIVDVDVDDGTVSSNTSRASTRSNPSIYGDDEAELDIPQVLIVRGLEDARHGVYLKFLEILEERQVKWVEKYDVDPGKEAVDPLARPEEGKRDRSQPLPEGFFLIYVRPSLVPRRARQRARSLRVSQRDSNRRGSRRDRGDAGMAEDGSCEAPGWFIDKFALSCLAAEETVLGEDDGLFEDFSLQSEQGEPLIDGKVRNHRLVTDHEVLGLSRLKHYSYSGHCVDSRKRRTCTLPYVSGYPT
jgi:hypothetical protein